MSAAWCVIGEAERAKATELDYSEFYNYWSNLAAGARVS